MSAAYSASRWAGLVPETAAKAWMSATVRVHAACARYADGEFVVGKVLDAGFAGVMFMARQGWVDSTGQARQGFPGTWRRSWR